MLYLSSKLFLIKETLKNRDNHSIKNIIDPAYHTALSVKKYLENNNELKYSNSVNVEEMEDIFDKPMVEVDININDNPEEQVQEDQVDQSQSSGRTMSRR